MFISLSKTFENVCILKYDVRGLIPELIKKGNYINDVILPPWSDNNPGILVSKMRNFMENNCENINKWIDLIFGYNQRGENADFVNNIFMAQTYENMVKIEEADPEIRESLMRLIEIGVTPYKIFFNENKERMNKNEFIKKSPIYSSSKGNFLFENEELMNISFESNNYKLLNEKFNFKEKVGGNDDYLKIIGIIPVNNIAKNYLLIFTNSNQFYDTKYNILNEDVVIEENKIYLIKNNSSKYSCSYIMSNLKKIPFIIYANCNYIIKGGFWDGRIELNSINNIQGNKTISKAIFYDYQIPIIIMKMSSDEKYLFCGTKVGLIIIFKVKGYELEKEKNIFKHSDEINDISIIISLNLFK